MEIKKENKYNADDMTQEYREGYKDGYVAGFTDGKQVHNNKDSKQEVR